MSIVHLREDRGHREEVSVRDKVHVDADVIIGVRLRGIVAEYRYVLRKICVNLLHGPVRAYDTVGVVVVLLPVEHELITVLKSLCFVQERRVAERAIRWEPARADGQDLGDHRGGRLSLVVVAGGEPHAAALALEYGNALPFVQLGPCGHPVEVLVMAGGDALTQHQKKCEQ